MQRRHLHAIAGALIVAFVTTGGYWLWRKHQGETLLAEARESLREALAQALEPHRIPAEKAAILLNRARELGQSGLELDSLLHEVNAWVNFQHGDLFSAEDELATAARLKGWTAHLHLLAGVLARAREASIPALAHVREARRMTHGIPTVELLAADLALDQGDAEEAYRILERMTAMGVASAAIFNRMGLALEAMEEYRRAEAVLTKGTRLDGNDPEPWINLGRIRHRRGHYHNAARAFTEALRRESSDVDAYLGRGLAYLELGLLTDAEKDFRRATEIEPKSTVGFVALADLHSKRGERDEAIKMYHRAASFDDATAETWVKLGNALMRAGQIAQATEAYEEAKQRGPHLAAAYNGLGVALLRLGEREAATDRSPKLSSSILPIQTLVSISLCS